MIVKSAVLAALVCAAALGISACSSDQAGAPGTPPSSEAAPAPDKPHHPHALRGTITAQNGNTWTVTSVKGATFTVNISPTTAFGTKKAPANAQSFPVGSQVVVAGKRNGSTVDATRVAMPQAAAAAQ